MNRTILIVEDYDDTRSLLKYILEHYGYRVIEAVNGVEALEKFKENFPDLIFMDLAMPLMDGLTATEEIRKTENGKEIPIIALTTHSRQLYDKAVEVGCNDFISKPIDFQSLESVLLQYFGES